MSTSSNRRRAGGFTLLEMLIVLAILGMLSAIALPRLRINEGARLRGSAHVLIVDLRLCRDEAIRRGTVTALVPSETGYVLLPAGRQQLLPSGITVASATPAARLVPGSHDVRFFPDGSSTGGYLTLQQGGVNVHVTVRGRDGKAWLHEW